MHIDTHYKQFWADALAHFKRGSFEYDTMIDDPTDKRFGLTLLIRPTQDIRAAINRMLDHLRQVEPGQYYYPTDDMHVTVLSIVSCYNGFTTNSYQPSKYIDLINLSVQHIHPFKLHFQGITASQSCVMVQGYPDGGLNLLRNNLREAFSHSTLEQSFDTRYTIMLAHATVVRFKEEISDPGRFLEALQKFRNYEFGTMQVDEVEFVFNDWYQRGEKGIVHGVFSLKG